MTTTQTRTAGAAIIALIIAGLLIATPAGAYLLDEVFQPVLDSIAAGFQWLVVDTLDSAGRTIGGLVGEFGELWDSIFG